MAGKEKGRGQKFAELITPAAGRRSARVTPEEKELWRRTMADVTRLEPDEDAPSADAPEPQPAAPAPPETPAAPSAGSAPARPVEPAAHLPRKLGRGGVPGLDRRTGERLRRGRMEISGRIDLHGMSQEKAHLALMGFVVHHWRVGSRCVLVITGKGPRGEGILRSAVPRWLADAPLKDKVLSFSDAQPADGGSGALYVLLKRQRQQEG
ncbi:Smr/MutS family protein [Radicibacter daui]|uniref:Smr/MutS family protein n=1 Tax=Radicibacter daui TaxID=3064829 RepID=UPI00404695A7